MKGNLLVFPQGFLTWLHNEQNISAAVVWCQPVRRNHRSYEPFQAVGDDV
tara:strand:- start:434 stop:583 length:150 start_codon:yes stop_codon:yes gene_type:complete